MADKIKIRLLNSLSGVEMHPAGSIIETTVKEATGLINAGFAELIDEIETADSKPARTRQTTRRRKKSK